jgi:hypothetical protein
MRIREYTTVDLDALRHMHTAQGFGYPLPNLDSPMFVSKLVLEEDDDEAISKEEDASFPGGSRKAPTGPRKAPNESGEVPHEATRPGATPQPRIVMAILQRLTAETYLLHDPAAGTPRQRWRRFLALHDAARRDAVARGLDDVQAFLPPRVARAFGRRLAQLGWARDPWPCFTRQIP